MYRPLYKYLHLFRAWRHPARHVLFLLCWTHATFLFADDAPGPEDIVAHCQNKYAGDDQRSRLIIVISDADGKAIKSEYHRIWKRYGGKNGIVDKVILFGSAPPDIRGVNFMRWGYTAASGKPADQWVYLPDMHMVRRVSQRDPANMDWGYSDEDLRIRGLEEDTHHLDGIERLDGRDYYVVSSVPRDDSAYGKRITYYNKADAWDDCAPRRVDFYDKNGKLLKQETLTWQRIGPAWTWDTAVMHNLRTKTTVTYRMRETAVNVGLDDTLFSERQLRRGYPEP